VTKAPTNMQSAVKRPMRVVWRSLMSSLAIDDPLHAQGRRGESQFLARVVASITLSSSRAVT
jgi:hypothetical protein